MRKVKACLLGFGGIGRAHLRAYHQLKERNAPVELVAICDVNAEQFSRAVSIELDAGKSVDASRLHFYTDAEEMIAKEKPDVVDICLPSYLHEEATIKMLRLGCHVLCEKPMALSSDACGRMIAAAEETKKTLMIGQCLRFGPAYLYMKDAIDTERYGKVCYAHFKRLSVLPLWGFDQWFVDHNRSGGCIMDLHIHDVDMIRFLFGEPKFVSSICAERPNKLQVVNSRFDYGNGTLIVADGCWGEAKTRPFEAECRIRLERAEFVCDGRNVTVYPDEGDVFCPELEAKSPIAEEILCLCNSVLGQSVTSCISPVEASKTIALLEKLRDSADGNGTPVRC
ncbi:MAG: Gfo/Idh/MocA family oxidoreductase [Clostridia bacterium]|nr:Gfo/Idh/MocA family oxidoreductase [Clostridia bacterium]